MQKTTTYQVINAISTTSELLHMSQMN